MYLFAYVTQARKSSPFARNVARNSSAPTNLSKMHTFAPDEFNSTQVDVRLRNDYCVLVIFIGCLFCIIYSLLYCISTCLQNSYPREFNDSAHTTPIALLEAMSVGSVYVWDDTTSVAQLRIRILTIFFDSFLICRILRTLEYQSDGFSG